MKRNNQLNCFNEEIKNKFNLYNSLFLNLPYTGVSDIGSFIPVLCGVCEAKLDENKTPNEILNTFFKYYANLYTKKEQIDFMFRIISYIERQIVLYDSIEDASFKKLKIHSKNLTISDFFELSNNQKNWDQVTEKLSTFSARLVFTAHPTQFYPPSVLNIINRLRKQLPQNNIREVSSILKQLGLTSMVNSKKPTPLIEAKNIIYFLREVYYDAVGSLYSKIKASIGEDFDNPNLIKLGFWPGGDRDGNPFINAKTTMQVANELRTTLMKCYYHELKALRQKLTFKKVDDILNNLQNTLYNTMFNSSEIYSYENILTELTRVKTLLIENYHSLYLKELDTFITKVSIFKSHFATLDIRQDHSVHKETIRSILSKHGMIDSSLDELSDAKLTNLMLNETLTLDSNDYTNPLVKDTIENIYQLKDIQKKNGENGCNRYIISNSEDIFSVLFVYGLFRWSGYSANEINFDIVPLFETINGMKLSSKIMTKLFEINNYKNHLIHRNNQQTIMLGFSDGTKDGGYLKANWSIFKTKENLSVLCKSKNITPIFFDGRGGPPARGGGKTHRFYAAHTKQISNQEIQLTIQGQTITSTYGTRDQFNYNCEQLITASLSKNFMKNNEILNSQRQLIEQLSELSFDKYNQLKNHEKFIPYLEKRSVLRFYNKTNISSRPGKRGNKSSLKLTDLRAIPFVGSWSQLRQNVPGFYGIGTALSELKNQGKLDELKALFQEAAIFKALIQNCMMSLMKSNFKLTSYMSQDLDFKDFWNMLHEEFLLSKKMVLLISNHNSLMEKEPISKNSILLREKIVLPLLVIQQYALQKLTQKGTNSTVKELYEKIVTRSLYGNINASRNSA